MVQVRSSLCAGAARADPSGIQLVRLFRLVSTRGMLRSLRRPYHLNSHCIRRLRQRFCASNRAQRLPSRPARLFDLLARYLDFAGSFRQRARSPRVWAISHRIQCRRHPFRGPKRPRRLSILPAGPIGLLALHVEATCS
jgi:hypothetical protein